MITLKGLIQTLKVAKNPHAILWAKVTNKKAKVTLSNGAHFEITWSQFRFLRDNYNLVRKYQVEQIDDKTFKIHTGNLQIVGSQVLMNVMDEIDSGIYSYDYRGKVVLDIGGFEGESAAYFWGMGAKKVIIYEPVLEHQKLIEENVRLNKINAEIHYEGIGNEDSVITVEYSDADNCFGLESKGSSKKMVIKVRNIAEVIARSGADVIKVDCEGAEISLVNVPQNVLRKVEYAMIEVHSSQIRQAIVEKFKDSGFILVKGQEQKDEKISTVHFKRIC